MDLNLIMPLLILGVFYLFIIKPNIDTRKKQEKFTEELEKGKEVVTSSGIYGRVNKIEGDIVTLQVDTKTFIRIARSAISKELTEQAFSKESEAQQS